MLATAEKPAYDQLAGRELERGFLKHAESEAKKRSPRATLESTDAAIASKGLELERIRI